MITYVWSPRHCALYSFINCWGFWKICSQTAVATDRARGWWGGARSGRFVGKPISCSSWRISGICASSETATIASASAMWQHPYNSAYAFFNAETVTDFSRNFYSRGYTRYWVTYSHTWTSLTRAITRPLSKLHGVKNVPHCAVCFWIVWIQTDES